MLRDGSTTHTLKRLGLVLALVAAFGCGWLVSQIRNVNRVPVQTVWVNHWLDGVVMLVRNGRDTTLQSPEQVQGSMVSSLGTSSLTLAHIYDTLPRDQQERMQFWIPAARAIAVAPSQPDPLHTRRYLADFVDCVQTVQGHGGSVRACFDARSKAPASH